MSMGSPFAAGDGPLHHLIVVPVPFREELSGYPRNAVDVPMPKAADRFIATATRGDTYARSSERAAAEKIQTIHSSPQQRPKSRPLLRYSRSGKSGNRITACFTANGLIAGARGSRHDGTAAIRVGMPSIEPGIRLAQCAWRSVAALSCRERHA
jgi:hypothetical protein